MEVTAGEDDFVDDEGVTVVDRSQIDARWRRATTRSVSWNAGTNWDVESKDGLLLAGIDDFPRPSYVRTEPLPARRGVGHRRDVGGDRSRGSNDGTLWTSRQVAAYSNEGTEPDDEQRRPGRASTALCRPRAEPSSTCCNCRRADRSGALSRGKVIC